MIEISVEIRAGSGDPGPTDPPSPTPRDYDLGWLIPDWELTRVHNGIAYTHKSRPEWKEIELGHPIYVKDSDPKVLIPGLPMTVKWPGERIQLTGEHAGELWLQLVMEAGGTLTDYLQLIKDGVCFTDFTGGHAYNPVLTTNNPIYWLGDQKDIGGEEHINFRTLKVGSLSYMQGQLKEWDKLKLKSTISRREYGGRGVIPFWQLGGRDVPFVPFGKSEEGWMPKNRVRKMTRTESIQNSYYPER